MSAENKRKLSLAAKARMGESEEGGKERTMTLAYIKQQCSLHYS